MASVGSAAGAPTIEFKGRRFEPEEVRLIAEVVGTFRRLSRQELANTVCELLDWHRPNHGLKTWEARELLEVLEGAGHIELPRPASRGRPRGSRTSVPRTARGEAQPELRAALREVEPIRLRLVQTSEDRQLWRELVGRYHPEGHRVPFGAHLRYLVEIDRPRPAVVACLQVSSPAWRMAVRDRFIGWSEERRRANLQRIVNHSRFLVLPWVRVPHLASRVLGLMVRRLPSDWERAYGIEPVLIETLVEAGRAGTCYRAANWTYLGETTGRGRSDRHHRREGLARKKVFVYPMVKRATEVLSGVERVGRSHAGGGEMARDGKKDRGEGKNQKWQEIRQRFELLGPHLDERARRCWLGAEALAYGRGGVTVVSEACGVSHRTVEAGMREVREATAVQGRPGRIRRPGGGSKPIEERMPGIESELEKLVDPCTRGDPQSPLRWTSKSLGKLSAELMERGFPVGVDTVARLLRELNY
jgi:hypothetical protein